MGYSFDGRGINGDDKYKSRLATLTDEGHKRNVGALLACAPDLLTELETMHRLAHVRHSQCGRDWDCATHILLRNLGRA